MSIGRRLWNVARSELNSLLDRAATLADDEDRDPDGLDAFSERELEEELSRRKLDREIRERAARAAAANGTHARPSSSGPRREAPPPPRGKPTTATMVQQAYATLELKPGADLAAVKKQFRLMMRKYHPDRHAGSPEKEKAAHELSQKLTAAYATLEKHLARP